jgi:hypothetical protein
MRWPDNPKIGEAQAARNEFTERTLHSHYGTDKRSNIPVKLAIKVLNENKRNKPHLRNPSNYRGPLGYYELAFGLHREPPKGSGRRGFI